ncbi:hypothetical protein FB451DRAFT_1234210, partial [Mycena latifolia]
MPALQLPPPELNNTEWGKEGNKRKTNKNYMLINHVEVEIERRTPRTTTPGTTRGRSGQEERPPVYALPLAPKGSPSAASSASPSSPARPAVVCTSLVDSAPDRATSPIRPSHPPCPRPPRPRHNPSRPLTSRSPPSPPANSSLCPPSLPRRPSPGGAPLLRY